MLSLSLPLLLPLLLLLSPPSSSLPFWSQPGQNSQKTYVSSTSLFLLTDLPTYPAVQASLSLPANIGEILVDEEGHVVMITDLDSCVSYDPLLLFADECYYLGKTIALAEDRGVYTAAAGKLRRYTLENPTEDWLLESVNITRLSAVDREGHVFTSGLSGIIVTSSDQSFVNQFENAGEQPKMALSLAEDIIIYQTDLQSVEARVVVTGELLWQREFSSPIESIQALKSLVLIDTLYHLDMVQIQDGEIVQTLEAEEGINSLILYEDRMIVNRDRTVIAYTFAPTFSEVFRLEGFFDFLTHACGADDLFFLTLENELRAFSPKDGAHIWSYRFDEAPTKVVLGNGTIFVASTSRFHHLSMISTPPAKDPFPLWFLGWIIPLVLLVILFIVFAYRWNASRGGYEVIR